MPAGEGSASRVCWWLQTVRRVIAVADSRSAIASVCRLHLFDVKVHESSAKTAKEAVPCAPRGLQVCSPLAGVQDAERALMDRPHKVLWVQDGVQGLHLQKILSRDILHSPSHSSDKIDSAGNVQALYHMPLPLESAQQVTEGAAVQISDLPKHWKFELEWTQNI